MKFKTVLLTLGLLTSTATMAKPANYYRVWQGFKKQNMTQAKFLKSLPSFMEATVDLYKGRALNQYLVGLPPKNKPKFIPDEFALVALHSKKAYREIRSTPEGRQYSSAHWDVFEKGKSKSAPFHNFYQDDIKELTHNHAYDMFGKPVDWAKGHTLFFVGLRKEGVSRTTFLRKLKKHITLVKKNLTPKGLRGYIIIANENYEVAYINWKSKRHMERAFETAAGKEVWADAEGILKPLIYKDATPYHQDEVHWDNFISNI